jgi:flagellar basal body-associated protein FliL
MGEDEKNVADIEEEEAVTVEETPASTSPSKIIKLLFYVVGAVVALLLIIVISYVVTKNVQEQKYVKEQAIIVAPPPPPLANFDLPSFSATTSDIEAHFVKLTISLAYEENLELNAELVRRVPQFQHIINVILSTKRFEDLDSAEKKINFSEEVKANINAVLVSGKIKEIYFREIVVN